MIQMEDRPHYYPVVLVQGNGTVGVTADLFGLRLAEDSSKDAYSPLAMDSPDGSVGRRVLPQGFAIDSQRRCYFVQRSTGDIWFYDSAVSRTSHSPFRRIMAFPQPKQSGSQSWSLAANSESLFVIRPDHPGVTSIALGYWAVQEIDCFSIAEQALDVATHNSAVYVLTDRAIYFRRNSSEDYCKLSAVDGGKRLLIDTSGRVFVYLPKNRITAVDQLSVSPPINTTSRTLFAVPAVVTHLDSDRKANRQFVIPASLASHCQQVPLADSDTPPELAIPAITREMLTNDELTHGFVVAEDGQRVRNKSFQPSNRRAFVTGLEGSQNRATSVWFSNAVDSRRYRCHWDRVELSLEIPQGCRVSVSTQTFDLDQDMAGSTGTQSDKSEALRVTRLQQRVEDSPESSWTQGATFEAGSLCSPKSTRETKDFLVRSEPGRFLCLKIQLFGDGFSTPIVRNIMASGPRQSHVDFLPGVMQADERSRDFLERFILVFQTEWDRLEESIDQMNSMFDPVSVPESQLQRLADNLGITLPARWSKQQWRNLLKFSPQLLMTPSDESKRRIGGTQRGTVEHLRNAVRAILGGRTGLSENEMRGFPWVIEGYRERKQFRVGSDGGDGDEAIGDALAPPAERTLWGSDTTGRLQLGDNSVLGERRLIPSERRELDIYRSYAHRIRVVVPACWVPEQNDLCVLEAMIQSEKPAHVACDITLVRPGLRIGMQSTVGVDTILADWPPVVLTDEPKRHLGLGQGAVLANPVDHHSPPLSLNGTLGTHML